MQEADAFVDVRNEVCSKPVLKVKTKLEVLEKGQVLEVLADADAKEDILRIFGQIKGQKVHNIEDEEGHFRILIQKV